MPKTKATKKKAVAVKGYGLFVDERTNRTLGNLIQMAMEYLIKLNAPNGRPDDEDLKDIMAFIQMFSDKEHPLGWCEDPDCKWSKKVSRSESKKP